MTLDGHEFNGYKMYKSSEWITEYGKEPKIEEIFYILLFKGGYPIRSWVEREPDEWVETNLTHKIMSETFVKNLDDIDIFQTFL